jgi:hypothetical protein
MNITTGGRSPVVTRRTGFLSRPVLTYEYYVSWVLGVLSNRRSSGYGGIRQTNYTFNFGQ